MTVQEFYPIFLKANQRFSTDTRGIKEGDIFFALKGDNFNGNTYAGQALEEGATYAVVDENIDLKHKNVVRVDDVLVFMQELAQHHRGQFDIPIIAIAGSNGKTTTKELLIGVLSSTYQVHATSGNFNNHIGVPITLLSMPLDTEIGLIEIGTNSFGEIAFLSNLLEPNYGLITNIGKEHLEGFGDLEGVAREESELYNYLVKHDGFAFVNADDVYLNRMAHRIKRKRSYSLEDKQAKCYVEIVDVAPEIELLYKGSCIHAHLSGKHNAQNIAATIAVASYFRIRGKKLQDGILAFRSTNNRSELREIGTNNFMLDAYNANPSSMLAAIETFKSLKADNKVILLGDMFEIGTHADQEHREVLNAALDIDCTVMVAGKQFSKVAKGTDAVAFKTTDQLVDHLEKERITKTWFLIKGSRGMRMEKAMEAFVS
ncbi:MAG: UDP-N-acetylmuramoyl-tripeptide--D-alanyl-D-alanine ligase [Bacteroidetes bacterium]|jgi:UDP-N-acetylmuramoyl-tripeptide--D-alanyl-D-alanine ligase|nr:UDP-N-acetylmuramoyl-tripeptide--D-alanyl-D-alanine ligase [Bacteroidota bacterium]